jgi:hypothetical protein
LPIRINFNSTFKVAENAKKRKWLDSKREMEIAKAASTVLETDSDTVRNPARLHDTRRIHAERREARRGRTERLRKQRTEFGISESSDGVSIGERERLLDDIEQKQGRGGKGRGKDGMFLDYGYTVKLPTRFLVFSMDSLEESIIQVTSF